ncbi:MAG: hypothetical protein RJB36_1379 [Bacteroidota bacterium]|jgi:hypothetical protein
MTKFVFLLLLSLPFVAQGQHIRTSDGKVLYPIQPVVMYDTMIYFMAYDFAPVQDIPQRYVSSMSSECMPVYVRLATLQRFEKKARNGSLKLILLGISGIVPVAFYYRNYQYERRMNAIFQYIQSNSVKK